MSYRKIGGDTKMEAVIRVLRGERLTAVADEMRINRNSLSSWLCRFNEVMKKSFKSRKRRGAGQQGELLGELKMMKDLVARQQDTIERLRDSTERGQEGPRPEKCVKCGCERFYRKGFIQLQLGTLLNMQRNGLQDKIPVQKFVCVNCGHATHLKGPVALYHWVISKVKLSSEGDRSVGKRETR